MKKSKFCFSTEPFKGGGGGAGNDFIPSRISVCVHVCVSVCPCVCVWVSGKMWVYICMAKTCAFPDVLNFPLRWRSLKDLQICNRSSNPGNCFFVCKKQHLRNNSVHNKLFLCLTHSFCNVSVVTEVYRLQIRSHPSLAFLRAERVQEERALLTHVANYKSCRVSGQMSLRPQNNPPGSFKEKYMIQDISNTSTHE